jgi:2,3-bisphosphoglycerate-independent phosphoglycerate mutase
LGIATKPFKQKPQIKAKEITDTLIKAILSQKFPFLRVNYANGDMVGHTGVLDLQIQRLYEAILKVNGTLIIIADHGNCEQMIEIDKKTGQPKKNQDGSFAAKTSHTLNPVPFVLLSPELKQLELNPLKEPYSLGNIASTILTLLGLEPPSFYLPPIVRWI